MRRNIYCYCFLLMFITGLGFKKSFSQKSPSKNTKTTRLLIVFDVSKSMIGNFQDKPKMDIAKQLCVQLVDRLSKIQKVELALRMYGFQTSYPPGDCKDSKLVVPFSKGSAELIKSNVRSVSPTGITPIAHSLNEAANDFPPSANTLNMIILITDGIEECKGDPCEAAANLQKKGIVLKPFILGIGLSKEQASPFDCVGSYFDITGMESITTLLNIIIFQTLNPTTVQVNLLDIGGYPSETDVDMTFYSQHSGAIKYNYMHTLNEKGRPDTISIDPMNWYTIVTHTIPPVSKDSISFVLGKHNVVAMDAPQGILSLKYQDKGIYTDFDCIVRRNKTLTTLHVQNFNSVEKYIVGKYDLEILSLPRIYLKDVNITQGKINEIIIEAAGRVTINTGELGSGCIFLEKGNGLEWVCILGKTEIVQTVDLQPGNYRAIFLGKTKKESIYTTERKFNIKSNVATNVYFN